MEKRKLYYAVVNDNGEQVLNALKQKGGTLSEELAKVTPRNGDIYFITEDGDIDAYDNADSFQRMVLDEFLGASGVEYVRLSDVEVRDIWRKIYIIADGTETTGARIIDELKRRGGIDDVNLTGRSFKAPYFIGEDKNIHLNGDISFLEKQGYTRYELPAIEQANEPAAPVPLNDSIKEINATINNAAKMHDGKVYVVSDGNREHNAAITRKLHLFGGIDYFNNTGNGQAGGVYYLNDKMRICYIPTLDLFNEKINKGGAYCEIPLADCIVEYEREKPLSAPAPAPNDNPKVCVVSDGNKRHNAAIIERLHEYGGIDYLCNANAGEDGFVYYIDNKKRIRYGSMEHFNGESNYNRDYSEIPLQSCVDAYEKKHPQMPANAPVTAPNDEGAQYTTKPYVCVQGAEIVVKFNEIVPKGFEVLNEQGEPITEATFKMRPKHYRPKYKQIYYYVLWIDDTFIAHNNTWDNDAIDEKFYRMGNCFETEEQAQRLADGLNMQFKTSTALIHASNGK